MNPLFVAFIKEYGIPGVAFVLLILYHQSTMHQWERIQHDMMTRWDQTLKLSQERAADELKLISDCCKAKQDGLNNAPQSR